MGRILDQTPLGKIIDSIAPALAMAGKNIVSSCPSYYQTSYKSQAWLWSGAGHGAKQTTACENSKPKSVNQKGCK